MNKKLKEIINYIFFGVLTTAVNIVTFYIFDTILNWQYLWANAMSIVISILFAYVTNKLFVFESQTTSFKALRQEFVSFISFRLLSGVFDMLSMWVLVDFLIIDTTISKLLTQFVIVGLNYIFSKFFIFNQK